MKYILLLIIITCCSCTESKYYSPKQVNSIISNSPKEHMKFDSIDRNNNINNAYYNIALQ